MKSSWAFAAATVLVVNAELPVWAADGLGPAQTSTAPPPITYRVSGGIGLGVFSSADIRSYPSGGIRPNTVSSPTAISLSADLLAEYRLGGSAWVDVAIRMGTLTETPGEKIAGDVFVDGTFASAEAGAAYRMSALQLRLTGGVAHVDEHWSRLDTSPEAMARDGVTSWGMTVRPEVAVEWGPMVTISLGIAHTVLLHAVGPVDELYLAVRLGGSF